MSDATVRRETTLTLPRRAPFYGVSVDMGNEVTICMLDATRVQVRTHKKGKWGKPTSSNFDIKTLEDGVYVMDVRATDGRMFSTVKLWDEVCLHFISGKSTLIVELREEVKT